MKGRALCLFLVLVSAALVAPGMARAAGPQPLTIFAAGTLAVPFTELGKLFQTKNPDVVVQPQFGGSVKMAKQVTELHQPADLIAVADYSVIPTYLFGAGGKPAYASWYVGFARNAITFVYTDKSKYAGEISASNWYQVLARPGVEIGRSDPDTDPSGYQAVQMLQLAERHYGVAGLSDKILANAPRTNMRDTETALISALQLGQIDYLAIYRSDALQHQLKLLDLPAAINLSDPNFTPAYAKAVAHTANGDLPGRPIVYAVSMLTNGEHPELAERFLGMLLGPDGRGVMAKNGFGTFAPAFAVNPEKMPASLRPLVKPWPSS